MQCEQTSRLDNKEYLQEFNKKVNRSRVPLSGNIDLTHRCNLRCVHCYVSGRAGIPGNLHKELSTAQWQRIIDEITAAGCLFFLITGGEPLLRSDFETIYRHAKMNGLLVAVFTNGTLINEKILALFSELPPRAVEITLYGASKRTYEKITGVSGSYEKCIKAIENLKERQINVKLKTMLMTLNQHEFFDIENMAKEYGTSFRFDAALFPTLTGDKTPIDYRVRPADAVEKELSDNERFREWQDFYKRIGILPESDTLYRCGAGHTHFHVDPYGNLQPCMMVTNLKYNLAAGDFLTGWEEVMPRLRDRKSNPGYPCNKCEKRTLCGFCPAFFNLENGSEEAYSQFLCEMGQIRYEKIHEVN